MIEFELTLTNGETRQLKGIPDNCPFCFQKITPNILTATQTISTDEIEVFLKCPNSKCKKTFIGCYSYSTSNYRFILSGLSFLQNLNRKHFNEIITEVSATFESIYNQAFQAEQMGLTEICGVGYRKALEFLIKDYLISLNPDKEDVMKSKMLGPCINEFVTNIQIKTVVERAVWIGNDETHYTRKWENKGIEDLKKLIDLSVHWIEMEVLTASFEIEMPKPSK